jgi:hypothetical protein
MAVAAWSQVSKVGQFPVVVSSPRQRAHRAAAPRGNPAYDVHMAKLRADVESDGEPCVRISWGIVLRAARSSKTRLVPAPLLLPRTRQRRCQAALSIALSLIVQRGSRADRAVAST